MSAVCVGRRRECLRPRSKQPSVVTRRNGHGAIMVNTCGSMATVTAPGMGPVPALKHLVWRAPSPLSRIVIMEDDDEPLHRIVSMRAI